MSKLFTITAAMILVEDGLLGLNRPVSTYIPEFTGDGKSAVMVHHLLTYTSGIGKDHLVDAYVENKAMANIPPPAKEQHPQIHEFLWPRYDVPLSQPPGSEMVYSGFGIELLGEIVRRVSGKPLPIFARERIFEPLGMKDSHYALPNTLKSRLIKRPSYAPYADLSELVETESAIPWASRGMFSTAKDVAIFGQMFLSGIKQLKLFP